MPQEGQIALATGSLDSSPLDHVGRGSNKEESAMPTLTTEDGTEIYGIRRSLTMAAYKKAEELLHLNLTLQP